MNPKLINLITESGLKFVRSHHLKDDMILLEATHKVNHMAIGLYLILPMTYEQFAEISSDMSRYAAFEEEMLSPFYFRLKGDWGWNLYLCIVLEDEIISQIPLEKLARIERAKKYAKKMIIAMSDFHHRIPTAQIPRRISSPTMADPVEDWERVLAPLGLDFCLDDYKSALVDEYVEKGFVKHIRAVEWNVQASPQLPNGSIQSLDFGHTFRSHVLAGAPVLDFAKVNLLYGPNGMGKTSVLECIELSFTGSIQRNVLSKASEQESWDGYLSFVNHEGVFRDIPDETIRKEREMVYYKHQAGRARSQMNRLFHQYNFFSSEAVHQFCYHVEDRSSYRDDFARVIFGEQLQRMEDRWVKYREEFTKLTNRLQKQIKDKANQLEEIQHRDLHQSQLLHQRVSYSARNIRKWANLCQLMYPMVDSNDGLKQIEEWLLHLMPFLKALEVISQPLFHEELSHIDQEESLYLEIDMRTLHLTKQKQHRDELTQSLMASEPQEELTQELGSLREQVNNLLGLQSRLSDIANTVRSNANVYNQSRTRHRRRFIQQRKADLIQPISHLTDFLNEFKDVKGQRIAITSLDQAEREMEKLSENYAEALLLFNETAHKVVEQEKRVGKLQRLASTLKAAGVEYVKENKQETQCPLCGHDHEDHMMMMAAIEQGLEIDDAKMTALYEEKERTRVILTNVESSMQELSRQNNLFKEYVRCYDRALLEQEEFGISIERPFSTEYMVELFHQLENQLSANRREMLEIDEEIKELERQGYTLTRIEDLEQKLHDPLLQEIDANPAVLTTSEQSVSFMELEMQRYAERIHQINATIKTIEMKLEVLANEKTTKKIELAQLEQSIRQAEIMLENLRKANQALELLRSRNVEIQTHTSWKQWHAYHAKLLDEADSLRNMLEPAVLLDENERAAQQVKLEISRLTSQLERGQQAIGALSELRTLASYSDEFIASNFEAISKLFVALHAPNEFTSLVLNADNQLIAKRKGISEDCMVHQMSTGQRTAVTLAIFFVMHLVMDTAPQFLMLDEPVANMDELNVLGLLDFLRQLSVSRNTQIFFTTANPQVATLFRRKFSFLKEDFKAYHFQRYLEGPVHIHLQQFNPQREEAVVTRKL